jgi:hypothetical protein
MNGIHGFTWGMEVVPIFEFLLSPLDFELFVLKQIANFEDGFHVVLTISSLATGRMVRIEPIEFVFPVS